MFDRLILDLVRALVDLFLILRGEAHGIFQGTHEAALFEAQGGQIGPGGFDHLNSLRQTAAAIQTRQDALNLALNRIQGIDAPLGGRLRSLCDPILELSEEYLSTAAKTENAAVSLRASDPVRFEGVILGQGGLGPEIGRTSRALVTNQLNQMSVQLASRGIEPRLIPTIRASLQSVTVSIRQLPTEVEDAIAKLTAALTAMRVALTFAARQALLAGRAALAAALTTIEEALVSLGSRLTSGIIIVPNFILREMKRAAGLPDPVA